MKTITIATQVVVTVQCDTYKELGEVEMKLIAAGWMIEDAGVLRNPRGDARYAVTAHKERTVGSTADMEALAAEVETLLAC